MLSWFRLGLVIWVQVFVVSPDLVRLPALFHHYVEHLDGHPDLGLFAFLAEHYGDPGEFELEMPGHDALPFHHHHNDATVDHCSTKLIASEPVPSVSFPLEVLSHLAVPLPDDDLSEGFRSLVLQPPRMMA